MTASSTVQHAAEQLERREARRGDKLGRAFLSARRAKPDVELWAQLEKKIKNRTPWRDRWVWVKPHRDRQLDGELEDMRAQVAGRLPSETRRQGRADGHTGMVQARRCAGPLRRGLAVRPRDAAEGRMGTVSDKGRNLVQTLTHGQGRQPAGDWTSSLSAAAREAGIGGQ